MLTSILAFFGGSAVLTSLTALLGSGGLIGVIGSFLFKHPLLRRVALFVGLVLAGMAVASIAFAWHAHRVRSFGTERYNAGYAAAQAICRENELRGERDELRRQLEATNTQLDQMKDRARVRESDNIMLETRVSELTHELEKEAEDAAAQSPESPACTYERVGPRLRGRLCDGWGLDCGAGNGADRRRQ